MNVRFSPKILFKMNFFILNNLEHILNKGEECMNSKEYLQQIRKLNVLIDIKWSEIQSLRSILTNTGVSVGNEPVKHSTEGDKFSNVIGKIIEAEEELNKSIDEYVDLKKEVLCVTEQLEPKYLQILYKRYFEFKRWEVIADEIGYNLQHTTKLHGYALKMIDDIRTECYENTNEANEK